MFPVPGQPLAGRPGLLEVDIFGELENEELKLVSEGGKLIKLLGTNWKDSSDSTSHEYLGEVELPTTPFRIAMTGTDAKGLPFERHYSPLLHAESVEIEKSGTFEMAQPGEITLLSFIVRNVGSAATEVLIKLSFCRETIESTGIAVSPNHCSPSVNSVNCRVCGTGVVNSRISAAVQQKAVLIPFGIQVSAHYLPLRPDPICLGISGFWKVDGCGYSVVFKKSVEVAFGIRIRSDHAPAAIDSVNECLVGSGNNNIEVGAVVQEETAGLPGSVFIVADDLAPIVYTFGNGCIGTGNIKNREHIFFFNESMNCGTDVTPSNDLA
jgi:hypothetical protein